MIIPVYRHKEGLLMCLKALSEQSYPPEKLEIIVVDNDLHDPLVLPPKRGVRVEREPVAGSYRARNTGVARSSGDVLVFTDADCLPDRDWIHKGVMHLIHTPECGMVGGRITIEFVDSNRPSAAELYDRYTSLRQSDYLHREHFAATANLFTFRRVFQAVGPFHPRLRSSGDLEWGQRVFDAGFRQVYASSAIVRHPARQTLGELVNRCRRIAGGRLALARRARGKARDRLNLYRKTLAQVSANRRRFGTMKMFQVCAIACLLRAVEWAERGRCRLGATPLR